MIDLISGLITLAIAVLAALAGGVVIGRDRAKTGAERKIIKRMQEAQDVRRDVDAADDGDLADRANRWVRDRE